MNRSQLVTALSERIDTTRRDADAVLTSIVDLITATVAAGEDVAISGFAKFRRVAARAAARDIPIVALKLGRSEKAGLPEESGLSLNAAWHIAPGRPEEPETLYLGGDPGVLFRSRDGGESWEVNRGLLEHPTRERWFPGAGGMSLHSIQLDPHNHRRMYVAITSAGVFRSDDGGASWIPRNRDVVTEFLADPRAEVGHCPHKLLLHPARPGRLWQQNHFGVYRSDDRGDTWARLDGNGLPSSFGFPLMLDPGDPDTAYVIPETGFEYHYVPGGRLIVYRTRDGGETWEPMADGLPEQAWAAVLREA